MKATTLLRKQHKIVRGIFKKLEGQSAAKKTLLRDLANNLAAHMAIEQEIFYPAVKDIDEDLVFESFEEHALAEIALKRLLATDPSDDSFAARVTVTKELVQHHVDEEEHHLFPQVEKKMADALDELGDRMQKRFDRVVKQGFKKVTPSGAGMTSSDREKPQAMASA